MSTRRAPRPPQTPARASKKKAPARPRAVAAEETRTALLEAGERLFAQKGLDGPSLDDICAAAGYTRGAFYVHFKDREAFLAAVMERVGLPFLDELLGDQGTPPPSLAEVVPRFLAAVASGRYPLAPKGSVRPHQLLDACARSAKIRRRYVALIQRAIERSAAACERARADGWARDDVAPGDVGTLLLALVIGAQTMLELGVPLDLSRAAGATMLLLRRT
jgi:TetR/AcrR family transcriptional regulator, transcriptional repressor for nem operon